MLPHAGEPLGRSGAKPLDKHTALRANGQERLDRPGRKPGQRELDRTGDKLLLRGAARQHQVGHSLQFGRQPVVTLVPAPATVGQHRPELGQGQGRRQVAHAQAEIGRVVVPAFEHGLVRTRRVCAVEHVAAGEQDGLRRQVGVIGYQQATFACVGVFVALQAETSRPAPGAGGAAAPAGPHGVGAVLDQLDAVPAADGAQLFHVADVTAHVRQQQGPSAAGRRFALQVAEVDGVVVAHVHQHRPGTGVGDCARHRGQREAVGQHGIAGLHTRALERHEHARPAGVQRHAVAHPEFRRKSRFEPRRRAGAAVGLAVAVQLAAVHQVERRRHAVGRYRLLLAQVDVQRLGGEIHCVSARARPGFPGRTARQESICAGAHHRCARGPPCLPAARCVPPPARPCATRRGSGAARSRS